MNACINHPKNTAIEHCEVCGDPLCDLCLWYGDDGRRLCERHARVYEEEGGSVQSPGLYKDEVRLERGAAEVERGIYRGNETDLTAAAAAMLGAAALSLWFGGTFCIPLFAAVLGVVALTSRRKGLNEKRVKRMGLFGIGMGLLGLLPFLFFLCFFAFTMGLAISGSAGGP